MSQNMRTAGVCLAVCRVVCCGPVLLTDCTCYKFSCFDIFEGSYCSLVSCDTVQYCRWVLALQRNVLFLSSSEYGQGAARLYKQGSIRCSGSEHQYPLSRLHNVSIGPQCKQYECVCEVTCLLKV